MGFSRQECWSGLPFPSPGDLPNPGVDTQLLHWQVGSLPLSNLSKSCLILCDPMDWSMPGFPVLHYLLEFAQIHVHLVSDAVWPFHPLLPSSLLPSVFPSIRVFSSESALCIRWSEYIQGKINKNNLAMPLEYCSESRVCDPRAKISLLPR